MVLMFFMKKRIWIHLLPRKIDFLQPNYYNAKIMIFKQNIGCFNSTKT